MTEMAKTRSSARSQRNELDNAGWRILSFSDPKDASLLMLFLGLAFLLRHFVHKSVKPGGKLRKLIKKEAAKVQEKRSKKILAIFQDPFLVVDLERRLEYTLGDKDKAKAEARRLKEESEKNLNAVGDDGDSDGEDSGTTFAKILVARVNLIYLIFYLCIWIFLPICFSVVCSPIVLIVLPCLMMYDSIHLGKKYGLKVRFSLDVFRRYYIFFKRSQTKNSELQESLLEKEDKDTSEVVPTLEKTSGTEV